VDWQRERALLVGLADTRRQMIGDDDSTLAGVTVARHIAMAARRDFVRRVSDARAAGHSWEQLAAATPNFVGVYGPDAGQALFEDVGLHGSQIDPLYAAWRCGNCDGLVLDRGPSGGHPLDAQPGHQPECARLAEETRRYLDRREELDVEDAHLARGQSFGLEL
ncbi:MAG: hypothetical protein ACRD1K_09860, partial [Acidimicrobiales bacterium]